MYNEPTPHIILTCSMTTQKAMQVTIGTVLKSTLLLGLALRLLLGLALRLLISCAPSARQARTHQARELNRMPCALR